MLMANVSLFGWLHTIACLLAIPSGLYILAARKGTVWHRRLGGLYASTMAAQGLLIMAVYHFDILFAPLRVGPHIFGIFHWEAVITILAVGIAVFAASRQRRAVYAHIHAQAMLFSYYLLLGGLINEAFLRIALLHGWAMALSPHAPNAAATLPAGLAQTGAMVLWLTLAIWFAVKVNRSRAPKPATLDYPLRYNGGAMTAIAGLSTMIGAMAGKPAYGLALGMVLGFVLARRAASLVRPRWGRPSTAHLRVMVLTIGAEIAIFSILGRSGFFQHALPLEAWQVTATIVGLSLLPLRFSHGPLMAVLGLSVLAWLGLCLESHAPLLVMALGDGAIKLGFGVVMALPLLRATNPDALEYRRA